MTERFPPAIAIVACSLLFASLRLPPLAAQGLTPQKVKRDTRYSALYQKLHSGDDVWGGDIFGVSLTEATGQQRYIGYYPETQIPTAWIDVKGAPKRPVAHGRYVSRWPNGRSVTYGQASNGLAFGTWFTAAAIKLDVYACLSAHDYGEPGAAIEVLRNCITDSTEREETRITVTPYRDGAIDGTETESNLLGAIQRRTTYEAGRMLRQVGYDTLGQVEYDYRYLESGDIDSAASQLLAYPASNRSDTLGTPYEVMPTFPSENCDPPDSLDLIADRQTYQQCATGEMLSYIYHVIRYPKSARREGITGTSVVTFGIEEDGSLTEARTVQFVSKSIDEESLRVVGSMSKWRPGFQNGKPVRVQFNLPIMFRLE